MLFGEALRKLRKRAGISLKELSRLSEVSPSYLSVLENEPERIPSKEILAKLIYGLRQGDIFNENVLNGYIEIQDILLNTDNLVENRFEETAFMVYFKDFIAGKFDEKNEWLSHLDESCYENKIIFFKNGRYQTTQFPSFDLEWLLKQSQFEVFYGRKYLINDEALKHDDDSRINYNTLTDEDKKIIKELVKAYISSRYETIKNPKEFFNEQSVLFSENQKEELKKIAINRYEKFDDKSYLEVLKILDEQED